MLNITATRPLPLSTEWNAATVAAQETARSQGLSFAAILERAANPSNGRLSPDGFFNESSEVNTELANRPIDLSDDVGGSMSNTPDNEETKLKEVFEQFVAQTFFGLLLKEMRKSVPKTKYFHGGLAEDIFEQHLDMAVAEKLAHATGDRFAGPMYELFQLQRQSLR
ncbi:MAG: rod-binding protein [Thermogutta sp.]